MLRDVATADCDECGSEDAVRPHGPEGMREFVCDICDAEMSSSRFGAAKME